MRLDDHPKKTYNYGWSFPLINRFAHYFGKVKFQRSKRKERSNRACAKELD